MVSHICTNHLIFITKSSPLWIFLIVNFHKKTTIPHLHCSGSFAGILWYTWHLLCLTSQKNSTRLIIIGSILSPYQFYSFEVLIMHNTSAWLYFEIRLLQINSYWSRVDSQYNSTVLGHWHIHRCPYNPEN